MKEKTGLLDHIGKGNYLDREIRDLLSAFEMGKG